MALVFKDRVKETTTTTGTDTITLAGAVDGFQAFSLIGNANTTYYTIVNGDNWETGLGTYTLSGTTLSRPTILESSSSGSAITLAGESTVFCTYPATKAVVLNSSSQINDADVVVTASILDDAVTADKLANSINTEITANTAKVTNATHTGDVTGATALTIANDAVITAKILDSNVTDAKIAAMSSSKLTGALPAIDGSALTNLPADSTKLPLAGGTLTGNVTLEAITETKTTKSISFTPNLTDDGTLYSCSGTMTITMPAATSGKSFTIVHATATSITWAGTIKWNGGSAPTLGSGIDIYVFVSDGTNWYANQAGTGYA